MSPAGSNPALSAPCLNVNLTRMVDVTILIFALWAHTGYKSLNSGAQNRRTTIIRTGSSRRQRCGMNMAASRVLFVRFAPEQQELFFGHGVVLLDSLRCAPCQLDAPRKRTETEKDFPVYSRIPVFSERVLLLLQTEPCYVRA